ncbi:hypothetical protein KY289_016457 [Solanum tuberosum]|nr:hypothetical protein KY289_016457 [Solanum tuberosum]
MKKRTSLIIKGSSMTGAPTNDQFRPPDPATGMNMHDIHTTIQESTSDSSYNSSQREEAIHTALAEQELDETCTNVSMEDLRQFHDTRIPAQQETQKSHDFSVPSVRNLQATVAENVGKSSQKRHQNRSIDEVIQTELAIGVCTTGRGGHPTDVLGNFHGEITGSDNSGESTGVQVNLAQKEDMQSLSQTQNTHRAGKEKVQELGQSSSSHLDVFVKKQGDTGTIPIDNSRSCVIPAYNSDTELHRTENHPSKVWVAKEQDHPTAIRQGQSNQGKDYTRTDQQQDYHSNFPRISSNFDRQVPKSNVNIARIDRPQFPPPNSSRIDPVAEPAPYTLVQTYADRLRNNQAKSDVSITLTAPEITTKQALPAVLYVKDEIIKDLAAACKYTLIEKFSTTMPKVDLIRNNFILQTQLSGGVKIAHFNSHHVYIDLDNELDYNTVWTKQRMTTAGKVMRIQVWTPSFKPAEETSIVPIWISLPELPWHCYNKEFVTGLLSPIGKVLYLDSASIKKTIGSQARVKVQVDLTHKRPPYIWMGYIGEDITNGRWQKIEYDNIPDYCLYCKHQGHVENDCTIRQRDEEKRKNEIDNVRNKNNKDMDNNQEQSKGYKDSGPKADPTNLYNQQRDQGQQQGQQEDQWQTQRGRNNNQQQDLPPPLEEMDIYNGSKQHSRLQPAVNQQQAQGKQSRHVTKNTDNISGKEVIKGQAITGIDSMLPVPKPLETVIVVEEAIGGQQQGRFNNKSGDRLSKKRRQALKKKWKKSTGQDPDDTATGKQLDTHVDEQVANNAKKGRLTLDDYGAINYDDKLDPDNQSIENSDEDIEDTMHHTGQVLGSTFQDKCSDVQRMTKQQGLSPRERKQTRHKPHQPLTSMSDTSSRPMTRSKSKGY